MHRILFVFLLPLLARGASFVANPSFELNYNPAFPGYSAINNWTGGSGVNQSTGPFHNPGTPFPDGVRAGFQQGSGTLSQAISGLTPGKRYWIQFYYDARNCCGGTIDLGVQWNGAELASLPNVTASTGGAPYKFRNVPFEAAAAGGTLSFVTTAAGDATLNYDAVTIVQRDTGNAVLANPGFEAGGDSAISPVAGWTITGTAGINRSPSGLYANNGAAPEQDHVIYLRNQNSMISQAVSGLVPGEIYTIHAAVNARTGNTPVLRIRAAGSVLSETAVTPVGGAAPYTVRSVNFTASAATVVIDFAQTAAGDQTVLLDDIRVTGLVQEPLPCLGLSPVQMELRPGVQGQLNVTVPAQLLAFPPPGGVQVTIRSPNPLVARIPAGIDDIITLTWAQGDALTKSFLIDGVNTGSVNLEVLNSATLCVDRTVSVSVTTQYVRNPSFDIDAQPAAPGYGAITAWDSNSPLTGLNRAGQPFLDNGAVPDGLQAAFLQGNAVLSQQIAGLVPGSGYWLQLRYNARTGGSVSAVVRFAGNQIAAVPPVMPAGGANPFYSLSVPFTPAGSAGLLEIESTVTGDATLLLDAVSIVPRTPGEIVLQNPGFDASARVPVWPGYLGGRPVSGWTYTGGAGLNSDGAGPFTDNGDAPDQEMVCFLQQVGSVGQTVSGLTPGATYTLSFAVNARSAGWTAPGLPYRVNFGAAQLFSEVLAPVGAGPYPRRYIVFNAPAAAGDLRFFSDSSTGDRSLLLDDIRLIPGNADPGQAPVDLSSTIFGGNALRLAWRSSAPPGMVLEWSLITVPGSWLPVTSPPVIEGDEYTVYEAMDDARRFYRLRRP